MSKTQKITDDLDALLSVLPAPVSEKVTILDDDDNLLEVVLDLGRYPKARYVDREVVLFEKEVDQADLDYVVERIGDFDADNRAGMERTLHRISAIRNRRGKIVGLTCRVGRAVYGTIEIIQDLVNSGKSILILGRPGVGKTTMLREAARILAEKLRVVIVDTSNEIGGDGDVPHPAVGEARRMQVAKPSLQHEVMIEAVENHNPEVIVIDEIGRELEAQAARTIAERGVQLIGTAHGNTLDNILLNPTLSDLIGGIESVTLSDDEARRRGTQKTVLERRAPPTFDILVEIQDRHHVAVHADISASVDSLLRGYPLPPEIRFRDSDNKIHIQKAPTPAPATASETIHRSTGMEKTPFHRNGDKTRTQSRVFDASESGIPMQPADDRPVRHKSIYAYGVARNRLIQVVKYLGVNARVVHSIAEADTFVTLRRYYRERQQPIIEAEERGVPVYVLKSNTSQQIEQFLADLFNIRMPSERLESPLESGDQTQAAIQAVLNGEKFIDLPPAAPTIRRLQHDMAREANLVSQSFGKEPNRHVRIYRD
jgi:stage III sporulation protein SpoIIIAA